MDAALFNLWRYWMEDTHGFKVSEPEPYVWIPMSEERRHDRLFAHCEEREPVTRLNFESFDHNTRQTQHRVRFVPTGECEQIEPYLLTHFGGTNVYTSMEPELGYAMTNRSQAHQPMGYMASNWSIPRGLAPVRSAMRS